MDENLLKIFHGAASSAPPRSWRKGREGGIVRRGGGIINPGDLESTTLDIFLRVENFSLHESRDWFDTLLLKLNSFLNNYKFMTDIVSFILSENVSELSQHGHSNR